MKLIQKVPVCLGIVCMMLSSCSKEDVQTPGPQVGSTNEHSSLKTDAGDEQAASPYFAWWADSQTGLGYYPLDWVKGTGNIPNDLEVVPTGVSSLDNLWANPYTPWVKKLPQIPENERATKVLTVESYPPLPGNQFKTPSVTTMIKNLKPGKTYAITLYLATTIRDKTVGYNVQCAYAKSAQIKLYPDNSGVALNTTVDLSGKEAQWFKKTITFTPTKNNVPLYFLGVQPQNGFYTFTHLYVGFKAIKELTPIQPTGGTVMGL